MFGGQLCVDELLGSLAREVGGCRVDVCEELAPAQKLQKKRKLRSYKGESREIR